MSAQAPSERPPRIRRTAEDARTPILDATERRLVASGPSGIRLQDVAEDVGVSHPTILHHFGSREQLVTEVIQRRIDAMNQDVLRALAAGPHDEDAVRSLFDRLFEAFGPGGHARVVAFLALQGKHGPAIEGVMPLAQALQANREANCAPGSREPSLEDSYFTVMLVAFALFGEAIVGTLFRGEQEGARDVAKSKKFRDWLVTLVQDHLAR